MANPNPYYVHPGMDLGAGLQGLASTIMSASEQKRKIQAEEEKKHRDQKIRSGAMDVYRSGGPEKMMEYAIANPEVSQAINSAFKMQIGLKERDAERERQEYLDAALNFYQNPSEDTIKKYIKEKADLGFAGMSTAIDRYQSDPDGFKKMVGMDIAGMDPERFKAMHEASGEMIPGSDPADIQSFKYLIEGLPPDEIAKAKRVKLGLSPRASESAMAKAAKAFASESAKLQARLGLEPNVAGAVTAAKNEANAIAKEKIDIKSKETAWEVYDSAMNNLAMAMGAAKTGPFRGFIPAVTANEQIAEGSVAVMAPVLKQMFRTAGEGTFTDQDQKMLLNMVPTRKDLPKARAAKIKAIDSVVRAKLGRPEEYERPVDELSDEELMKQLQGM